LYYEVHQVQKVITGEIQLAVEAFCIGVRDDVCVAF
jgi:hypothetical protein